ncbi:MAG: entry exclusion lipoprotein TrbK [Methylobacter sp.]|jgi:entry exclusion lipoprotein TrbK
MNLKQLKTLAMVATIATLIVACFHDSEEEMPIVNNENCKAEGITKIEDKAVRDKFASLCARRGQFKPTPKKEW